jgi:hypothetical protein
MKRAGTDKQTKHGYPEIYDQLFWHFRFRPIRMLEIGFAKGRSAKAFAEYFPAAVIHCLDHSPAISSWELFPEEIRRRVILHKGDQGSPKDIQAMLEDIAQSPTNPKKRGPRKFHVVIDDGCHRSKYQITSFEELWPHVEDGGYYIIEDLHISYGDHRKKWGESETMKYFIDKIHQINKDHANLEKRAGETIEYISFPRNMVIIKKRECN